MQRPLRWHSPLGVTFLLVAMGNLGNGGCALREGSVFRSTSVSKPADSDGGAVPELDANVGDWHPTLDLRWQIQLVGAVDTAVEADMFDIDLSASAAIQTLREQGRVVICDFSAGTLEKWRSDASSIPPEAIGNPVADYPEENWLDFRNPSVHRVMSARMDLAQASGCIGVRPESLDGTLSNTGFSLTRQDQIEYDRQIAAMAHARGLSIGLTGGDAEIATALVQRRLRSCRQRPPSLAEAWRISCWQPT